MARPTEDAIAFFNQAEKHIQMAGMRLRDPKLKSTERQIADLELARGLWTMAGGLSSLSTGLRATYILLEEVKAALDKQK